MATSVVVKPLTEPVSLAEARAHLRLDTTDMDSMLAGYLLAARQYATDYTRRLFLVQTWDCSFDWEWPYFTSTASYRLDFPYAPVSSVSSISYVDTNNVTQTLDPALYLFRGAGPNSIPYVVPAHNATWPDVLEVPEAIHVRFIAGYGSNPGDVPEPIRTAILLHTEMLYDRDPRARETLATARDAMLDPYRYVRL